MQVWFKGSLFENQEDEDSKDYVDSPDTIVGTLDNSIQVITKKVDPSIVVKRIVLNDKLYANIIEFIKYNIGEVPELDEIREAQSRIHALFFEELPSAVSEEYNSHKGKFKENSKVREDATKRKVVTLYRFFAYYMIKYDKYCVEWMEDLIKNGLFNDSSKIADINGAYNNIDIGLVLNMNPTDFTPARFNLLDPNGKFNDSIRDFFIDAEDLVDQLARSAGVFNDMNSMLTVFKLGLPSEDKANNKTNLIPIGTSSEIGSIIEYMTFIDAKVNKLISVKAIRDKFISDYKNRLQKMNLDQAQMKAQIDQLMAGIEGGKINTVADFDKVNSDFKRRSTSDRDKEEFAKRSANMASAYKYKIESILNNRRGS